MLSALHLRHATKKFLCLLAVTIQLGFGQMVYAQVTVTGWITGSYQNSNTTSFHRSDIPFFVSSSAVEDTLNCSLSSMFLNRRDEQYINLFGWVVNQTFTAYCDRSTRMEEFACHTEYTYCEPRPWKDLWKDFQSLSYSCIGGQLTASVTVANDPCSCISWSEPKDCANPGLGGTTGTGQGGGTGGSSPGGSSGGGTPEGPGAIPGSVGNPYIGRPNYQAIAANAALQELEELERH